MDWISIMGLVFLSIIIALLIEEAITVRKKNGK